VETVANLAQHAALVAGLRDPAAWPHATADIEAIETHISTVLLAGEFAYKIKKPVNLGFADFSTLALRRRYCEEEIRLNRRAAPDLYLDVVAITGTLERPRIGGGAADPILDYAVRMRRFADGARLDRVARAGRLTPAHIDRLAAAIAALHGRCEPAPPGSDYGTPAEIGRWATENLATLAAGDAGPAQAAIRRLQQWTARELQRRSPSMAARRAGGHVRECHGDLHLGNLVLIDGNPLPFDCIEFNDRLRFIDVINDVAFTFMDLVDHGLPALAWRLMDAYLQLTGDYAGLAVLRFYAVYRALVRAKIAGIRLGQPGTPQAEQAEDRAAAARYVEVAGQLAEAGAARLILMCGVSGSGKSTVAQALLQRLGAIRVRSDLERKRLAGVDPGVRLPEAVGAGLYGADATRSTYGRLAELAQAILAADTTAIVDATFLQRAQRDAFRRLAAQAAVPCSIVACEAPPALLRARVAQRLQQRSDPSDASLEVLEHQLAAFETLTPQELACTIRVGTDTDAEGLDRRVAQAAEALRAGPSAG
jgi:hypothetical protein